MSPFNLASSYFLKGFGNNNLDFRVDGSGLRRRDHFLSLFSRFILGGIHSHFDDGRDDAPRQSDGDYGQG